MAYVVALVKGVRTNERRGIAFLRCTTDARIDAEDVFQATTEKIQRDLLGRFDLWLSGQRCDKYFHGWPNDKDHKDCFAFKWNPPGSGGAHHRLYGFLYHPMPITCPRFQACILASHGQKAEGTDLTLLSFVQGLGAAREVTEAVKIAFPERKKEDSHGR